MQRPFTQNMAPTVLIRCFSRHWQSNSLLFARKGYDLVLAARQPERLSAVAQEVQNLGRAALSVPTDVRDPDQGEHTCP